MPSIDDVHEDAEDAPAAWSSIDDDEWMNVSEPSINDDWMNDLSDEDVVAGPSTVQVGHGGYKREDILLNFK